MTKTCGNPDCNTDLTGTGKTYCNSKCRGKAYRSREKQKDQTMTQPLGNINHSQPGQVTVAPAHQLFDSPSQNQLYHNKEIEVQSLKTEIKGLKQLVEQAREQINQLIKDKSDQKQSYELAIRDQKDDLKESHRKEVEQLKEAQTKKIDELKEKIQLKEKEVENLDREIREVKSSGTINGIISQAASKDGGITELMTGTAQLVSALGTAFNPNGQMPGAPGVPAQAISPASQQILSILQNASPDEQTMVLKLIIAVAQKADKEKGEQEPNIIPIIQQLITQLNGTT